MNKVIKDIQRDWGYWAQLFVNQNIDGEKRKELKIIFINILSLVTMDVLSSGYIEMVLKNIEKSIKTIIEREDDKTIIYLSGVVLEFIDELIWVCEENELYEACSNIKKVSDELYVEE